MRYCVKCGAEIVGGGKFCGKCGTPVKEQKAEIDIYAPPEEARPEKPFNRKALLIAAASLCALIVIIVVCVTVSNNIKIRNLRKAMTVNAADYISVDFSGYDTIGEASVYMDYDGFCGAVIDAMGIPEELLSYEHYAKAENLYSGIQMRVEPDEGLSNGDSVLVRINFDKALAKEAGVILDFDVYEEEVQGLNELKRYDIFDYLELQYSGVSGYASLQYENSAEIAGLNNVNFNVDRLNYLRIGDEITFNVDDYSVDYLLNNYGIILETTEKTYKVGEADIAKYIDDVDDISRELINDMRANADEIIKSRFSYYWDGELSDVEYQGMYLLTPSETNPYIGNYAFIIYKGTVNFNSNNYWSWYDYEEEEREPVEVYLPVEIDNLIQDIDGTQRFDGGGLLWNYSDDDSGVPGYIREEELFNQIINANKENFEWEINGKLTDFSK